MRHTQMTESAFTAAVQTYLKQITEDAGMILRTLDEKDQCLLCELDELGHTFQEMQAVASSFYLQSYIEHFTPSYTELARAVQHLAEEKHGALIVIERADPLDGMIQKGTSLHAEISAALIESIFIPAIRFMTEPYWSEKTGLYQQPMCSRSQQNMSISNTGRATGPRWDFRP